MVISRGLAVHICHCVPSQQGGKCKAGGQISLCRKRFPLQLVKPEQMTSSCVVSLSTPVLNPGHGACKAGVEHGLCHVQGGIIQGFINATLNFGFFGLNSVEKPWWNPKFSCDRFPSFLLFSLPPSFFPLFIFQLSGCLPFYIVNTF